MVDFATAQAAQAEIGTVLAALAPEGWTECAVTYWEVGPVAEIAVTATLSDGSKLDVQLPDDDDLMDACQQLREATAEPDKGAWYTARFRLTPDLVLDADFDWDNPPPSSWEVTASAYLDDLEYFARDEAHRPPWLRTKLEAAATSPRDA